MCRVGASTECLCRALKTYCELYCTLYSAVVFGIYTPDSGNSANSAFSVLLKAPDAVHCVLLSLEHTAVPLGDILRHVLSLHCSKSHCECTVVVVLCSRFPAVPSLHLYRWCSSFCTPATLATFCGGAGGCAVRLCSRGGRWGLGRGAWGGFRRSWPT